MHFAQEPRPPSIETCTQPPHARQHPRVALPRHPRPRSRTARAWPAWSPWSAVACPTRPVPRSAPWPSPSSAPSVWSRSVSTSPRSSCWQWAAPAADVHLGAVVAGRAAGAGVRDHEPVPLYGDRPHRPGAGGDPRIPGPAQHRAGRLPPPRGRVLRGDRRGGCRHADASAPLRRLPRNGPRAAGHAAAGRRTSCSTAPSAAASPGRRGPLPPPGSPPYCSCRSASPSRSGILLRRRRSAAPWPCGVLSSAVPCLADLFTLRRVPAPAFGLFMSVNPVLAGLVGWIVLGQSLDWTEWTGIGAVVAANVLGILAARS